jgi:rod shape-determining protein MreC
MSMFHKKGRLIQYLIPLLLLLAFLSMTKSGARRAPWYEEMLWNLIAPPQALVSYIGGGISGVWNGYVNLVGVKKDNERLSAKVAQLQTALVGAREAEEENKRLRDFLNYKESFPHDVVVARVISNDPRAEFKSITIDRGYDDGIRPLMPVIGPSGLVGRVATVADGNSRVLLIVDPNSTVDVLVQRSRARGLLVGTSKKTELRPGYYLTRFEYLRRVSDVSDDDVVVTSGFDRVFPPGIPVGTVADLARSKYGVFLDANVIPFENMAELQEVMVIKSQVELTLPAVEEKEE